MDFRRSARRAGPRSKPWKTRPINDPGTRHNKARIKRLREPAPAQFRLRVGEYRVFYDLEEEAVLIIQILSKQDSADYLGGSL
jgi:mRNA-degrading endonuclease RelE of RelBE toxin-antitoxin system